MSMNDWEKVDPEKGLQYVKEPNRSPNGFHWSYSRISQYFTCARCYWFRYILKLKPEKFIYSNDALVLGSAMHLCAQEGIDSALKYYEGQFSSLNKNHVNEEIKFKILEPELHAKFGNHKHELTVKGDDGYIGYIDDLDTETGILSDFKYSNSVTSYLKSPQIHLYKYYGDQMGLDIKQLFYVFIPKVAIRQRKTETLEDFRKRLIETLSEKEIKAVEVPYSPARVYNFLIDKDRVMDITTNHGNQIEFFPFDEEKKFCRNCEYLPYCQAQKWSNEDSLTNSVDYGGYDQYVKKLTEDFEQRYPDGFPHEEDGEEDDS